MDEVDRKEKRARRNPGLRPDADRDGDNVNKDEDRIEVVGDCSDKLATFIREYGVIGPNEALQIIVDDSTWLADEMLAASKAELAATDAKVR